MKKKMLLFKKRKNAAKTFKSKCLYNLEKMFLQLKIVASFFLSTSNIK